MLLRRSMAAVRGYTMEILRHPSRGDPRLARVVLMLGNFDGVHRGHQTIVRRALGIARSMGVPAGLLTFEPHPASVLAGAKVPPLLVPLRGKLELLAAAGLDFVWIVRFTPAFANHTPEEFVRDYLSSRAGIAAMVVGHDVTFGRGRAGNARTLAELGKRYGFEVEVIAPVMQGDLRVSSTGIRRALVDGEAAKASQMLGRPHLLWGRVGRGERRGRLLGFPTANLRIRGGLFPRDGVYAVRVAGLERQYLGVANVGRKPTFGTAPRGVEVHILDFEGDLYGRLLRVSFVERLRAEARFESAEALVTQIRRDVDGARAVLRQLTTGSAPECAGDES